MQVYALSFVWVVVRLNSHKKCSVKLFFTFKNEVSLFSLRNKRCIQVGSCLSYLLQELVEKWTKVSNFIRWKMTERKYKRFTFICCSIEWKIDVILFLWFSFYIYTVLPFRPFVKIPPFPTPYGLVVTSENTVNVD